MDDLTKRVAMLMGNRPVFDLKLKAQPEVDVADASVVATPPVAKPSPLGDPDDESIAVKPASSTSIDNGERPMPAEQGDGDKWHVVNEAERVVDEGTGRKTAVPCATCGEPFTPKRPWGKYCSGACRVAGYRLARGQATD